MPSLPYLGASVPGITLKEITDGTSNTAMFGEIKRGDVAADSFTGVGQSYQGPPKLPQHVRIVSDWPTGSDTTAANLVPPADCNSNLTSSYYAGTQWYRDKPTFTSCYAHTKVPNTTFGDCRQSGSNERTWRRGATIPAGSTSASSTAASTSSRRASTS